MNLMTRNQNLLLKHEGVTVILVRALNLYIIWIKKLQILYVNLNNFVKNEKNSFTGANCLYLFFLIFMTILNKKHIFVDLDMSYDVSQILI